TVPTPSAREASSASSNVSPGMKRETARRTNRYFVACSRTQRFSEPDRRTLRRMLTLTLSRERVYIARRCLPPSRLLKNGCGLRVRLFPSRVMLEHPDYVFPLLFARREQKARRRKRLRRSRAVCASAAPPRSI